VCSHETNAAINRANNGEGARRMADNRAFGRRSFVRSHPFYERVTTRATNRDNEARNDPSATINERTWGISRYSETRTKLSWRAPARFASCCSVILIYHGFSRLLKLLYRVHRVLLPSPPRASRAQRTSDSTSYGGRVARSIVASMGSTGEIRSGSKVAEEQSERSRSIVPRETIRVGRIAVRAKSLG